MRRVVDKDWDCAGEAETGRHWVWRVRLTRKNVHREVVLLVDRVGKETGDHADQDAG